MLLFDNPRIISPMQIVSTIAIHSTFEVLVQVFVDGMTVYAAIGMLFASAFVFAGIHRIDTQAEGAGVGFRLLVFPGAIAFWPMLLKWWVTGAPRTSEKIPHE